MEEYKVMNLVQRSAARKETLDKCGDQARFEKYEKHGSLLIQAILNPRA